MPPIKGKKQASVSPIRESSPSIKRKEYYLASTSIYFRDPKEDDLAFADVQTKPQLFSNERKAKDYLKDKAELIKKKYLCEVKKEIIENEDKGDNSGFGVTDISSDEDRNDNRLLENAYFTTVNEEQMVFGIDGGNEMIIDTGIWGCLKFDRVVLNGILPILHWNRRKSQAEADEAQ